MPSRRRCRCRRHHCRPHCCPTMSGLNELVRPADRSKYASLTDITFALHDWAAKDRFSFRRGHTAGLSWVCATKETSGCQWKVRGERQKRWRAEMEIGDSEVYVNIFLFTYLQPIGSRWRWWWVYGRGHLVWQGIQFFR